MRSMTAVTPREARIFSIMIGTAALALSVPGIVRANSPVQATWTTLGTNSGPIPSSDRFEPANLLRAGDQSILVDAGDGASVQLARAGVPLTALHTIIISHLHFDHTGGLFAILGERLQMLAPGVLTIYGPAGTRATVDGLIAGMTPSPPSGPRGQVNPAQTVRVIEVRDGDAFDVGAVRVTAAANSHYDATPGGAAHVSLSYRFDAPGRSIAYTGDTGPSAKVEKLAYRADLLVSEIFDPDVALAAVKKARPELDPSVLAEVRVHFEREHLTTEQVGELAARAGVGELVLTHNPISPDRTEELMRPGIAREYQGTIRFARDLDTF
ncbi:beta-lactamase [Sphingobium baderi LL03]|nr:beta-lactamase [Sphingobium baderi LL03]